MEETLNAQIVFECPLFKVEEAMVRIPDGREEKRWYVVRRDAVGVLPVDEQGRLLLTREYMSAAKKTVWRVVMGDIEDGETPEEAAHREMREEIGYDAEHLELVLEAVQPSSFIKHKGYFFIARGIFHSPVEHDEFEAIEVVPSGPDEVEALIAKGAFQGNFAKLLRAALELTR